jgi:hypothetical protein
LRSTPHNHRGAGGIVGIILSGACVRASAGDFGAIAGLILARTIHTLGCSGSSMLFSDKTHEIGAF